jgi:hypothetical protein
MTKAPIASFGGPRPNTDGGRSNGTGLAPPGAHRCTPRGRAQATPCAPPDTTFGHEEEPWQSAR